MRQGVWKYGLMAVAAVALSFATTSARAGYCEGGVCSPGYSGYATAWRGCSHCVSPGYYRQGCYNSCYPVRVEIKDWEKRCNYDRIEVEHKYTDHGLVIEYDYDD